MQRRKYGRKGKNRREKARQESDKDVWKERERDKKQLTSSGFKQSAG
jgi:hypothetical protein